MTEATRTPWTAGPWAVSKQKARRVTASGVIICNAVLRNRGGPKQRAELKDEHEAEANASLISAAPDLYAALAAAQDQLQKAADQFAFYADEHSTKRTPEGDAKAMTNMAWARSLAQTDHVCRAALALAKGEQA